MLTATCGSHSHASAGTVSGCDSIDQATERCDSESTVVAGTKTLGVLIVLQDFTLGKLLKIMFERRGFVAWVTTNGMEALKLFDDYRDDIDVALIESHLSLIDGLQMQVVLTTLKSTLKCCYVYNPRCQYGVCQLQQTAMVVDFQKQSLVDLFAAIAKLVGRERL